MSLRRPLFRFMSTYLKQQIILDLQKLHRPCTEKIRYEYARIKFINGHALNQFNNFLFYVKSERLSAASLFVFRYRLMDCMH